MPTFNLALDAVSLFLLLSYLFSGLVAIAPFPRGSADFQAREALRRLFFPPLASMGLVALGYGFQLSELHHGAHVVVATSGAGEMAHGAAALAVLAVWTTLMLWHGYHWAQTRGRLKLLEALADPHRAQVAREALGSSGADWPGPIMVVAFGLPLCFVLGVRRPTLLMSTAVLEGLSAPQLDTLMSHERAHLARRDHHWRLAAQFAIVTHLPGLGRRAFRRWAQAAEAVCDEAAAERAGSRVAVADTLVRFKKQMDVGGRAYAGEAWTFGPAFSGSADLKDRVQALLDPARPTRLQPAWELWPMAVAALAFTQSEPLHRGFEGLLALLHW